MSQIKQIQPKKIKLPRKRKKVFKKENKSEDYWMTCLVMDVMKDVEHRIPNFRIKFPRVIEYYNPKNPISIKSIKQWY